MNYRRILNEFIADRRGREADLIDSGAYYERHHINPRSLGGGDELENLIALTAGDHFHAHLLLAQIYGGSQWLAVHTMSFGADVHKRSEVFSKRRWIAIAREKSRAVIAENTRKQHCDPVYRAAVHNEGVNRKRSETMKAWHQTPEGRAHAQSERRIAAATSSDAIERRSASYREWWNTPEGTAFKSDKSEMMRELTKSPEWLASLKRGTEHPRNKSPENWANAVEKMRGDGNPMKDPEVVKLAMANRRKGYKNNRERKIRCVETDIIYESISAAIKATNGSRKIGDVCRGTRKTSGGHHWEYVS